MALKPDSELDLPGIKALLARIVTTISKAPNRVVYTMNSFIVAVGSYVLPLTKEALATAKKIGTVTVDTNGTCCQVPDAADYIKKVEARGSLCHVFLSGCDLRPGLHDCLIYCLL